MGSRELSAFRSFALRSPVLHITRAEQPHGAAPVTVRYQHDHRCFSLYRKFQSTIIEQMVQQRKQWEFLQEALVQITHRTMPPHSQLYRILLRSCGDGREHKHQGTLSNEFQPLISSSQLVKTGDKPNSPVLTAMIIRHLLCSLFSL